MRSQVVRNTRTLIRQVPTTLEFRHWITLEIDRPCTKEKKEEKIRKRTSRRVGESLYGPSVKTSLITFVGLKSLSITRFAGIAYENNRVEP